MIEYSVPLLTCALMAYVGARLGLLAGWPVIAGALRLIALWGAAAWVGYTTPIYVAIACLPLGILWSKLHARIPLVVLFELFFGAILVWFSGIEPVVIYLVGLVIFDQLAARLLLTRYDRHRETNTGLHRVILAAGSVALVVLVWHYFRPPIESYADSQSLGAIANLQPEGPALLWYFKRELDSKDAGKAQVGSVYWQSRYPKSAKNCALSFHGANAAGSLQSAARTLAQGVQLAGLQLYAIDHPGFGASPVPAKDAPVDAWDPAHLTNAVLLQMQRDGCKSITVIGHSQGVTEALRVLTSNTPDVSRAYVLGAGLIHKEQRRR